MNLLVVGAFVLTFSLVLACASTLHWYQRATRLRNALLVADEVIAMGRERSRR